MTDTGRPAFPTRCYRCNREVKTLVQFSTDEQKPMKPLCLTCFKAVGREAVANARREVTKGNQE